MSEACQPRLLIFGATGYTGRALVALARTQGHETHAHLRPNSPNAARQVPSFKAIGATCHTVAWSPPTIAELVRAVAPTHVFCLLGTTKKKTAAHGEAASYASVDVGMTLMAVQAVADSSTPARLIYLSSAGVGPRARGDYLKARWQVESTIHEQLSSWVIARPSFISGPDRQESRPGERIGAVLSDGLLSVAGRLGLGAMRDQWSSLSASQLAAGLLHHAMASGDDTRTVDAAQLRQPG